MISASKEFKEKLKSGVNLVNYANITLSDGTVLHLDSKDFMIGGCTIEDKTTDGKFGVGFCIGKTLSIRMANHDERFSKYDFYQSIIYLYVAMRLDDGSIEKIRKGVYYTVVPETPGDIIEISAVDGMFKLDKDYSASTTLYPATLQSIISDACLDCGIPIGFRQFENMDFVVSEKPENTTYRQVVSWACQIAGYNAHIDVDGYMQLVWYSTTLLERYNYIGGDFKRYPHDTIVDGGNFTDYNTNTIISGGNFTDPMPEHIFRIKSLSVGTDDIQITGVRVVNDDEKTALFGEDGYVIEIIGNPFVSGKEQQIATYLGARMFGMVFRPFSAQVLQNPLYEPFEVVRVSDEKGNVYNSILNSVSYKIGGYTDIACETEDPVRNGSTYTSPAAQAVVEARRNTQKQISTYDKSVQNMNELAANAMGLFRKEELQSNGSYISYESDRPITVDENGKCHFEPGSHVWMRSDAGFFLSDDGGKTFTAGFDKDNNAVLNVLHAIGIVADWIRGGILQGVVIDVGGLDNARGVIHAYGKNAELMASIDGEGVRYYNSGESIGYIGVSHFTNYPQYKGLGLFAEKGASNLSFFMKSSDSDTNYRMTFACINEHRPEIYPEPGLYLGNHLHTGRYYIKFDDYASAYLSLENNLVLNADNEAEIRLAYGNQNIFTVRESSVNCWKNLDMHNWSIVNTSDERLKTNIVESEINALEIIKEIQTYSFDWIEDEKHEEIGFIAQQLGDVSEDFVEISEKDGHYSTKDMKLIPYLVKSIQELTARVEELEKEVTSLKGEDLAAPYKTKRTSKKKWVPKEYTDEEKIEFAQSIKKCNINKYVEPEPIMVEG